MRRRSVFALGVFVIGVVTAGWYLAPNREEMALMQMNDADFGDALRRYSDLHSKGDTSINVLIPLINLRVHYGDMDKAIALLESYAADHPRSIEARRRLTALYKSSQRTYTYCASLEKLQELAPSVATLRELVDNYDFLGLYKEKMHALARLVATDGYHPREEDYMALATLYRVSGQPAEASQAMVDYVTLRNYDVSLEAMVLAAHVLLDNGEEQQALRMASAYIRRFPEERNAIMLASLLRDQNRLDSAYALLEPFFPSLDRSDELLEQLVTLQLLRGKEKEVYDLLAARLNRQALPASLTATMMDLALRYRDFARIDTLLRMVNLNEIPPDILLRYADVTARIKRLDLARTMQSRLSAEYLQAAPLLAAVLNVSLHDTPQAMAALMGLPESAIALPEQKLILAGIYLRHDYAARALSLFEGVGIADMFGAVDGLQYAELYLDAGDVEKGIKRLTDARPDSSPAVQSSIDEALFLMAAGRGKADIVDRWLEDHPDAKVSLLDDAYTLASRYHHPGLMLAFAQRLYAADSGDENTLQLADALVANRRYAEAMNYLKTASGKDSHARSMYLEAMVSWIRQAGSEGVGAHRATLENYIAAALKHNDMSDEEKRNLAYLLQEAGFRDKAEGIFLTLAADQPFSHPDTQDLLNFWGPQLSEGALGWIENRARQAYGPEKAQWLSYLNDTGHARSVIALMQGTGGMPAAVADQYAAALAAVHDGRRLGAVLAREIAGEQSPARLARLSALAQQEDLSDLSEKGWRKIYGADPMNRPAARELGLLAFAGNRYSEAKTFLDQYMQEGADPGDYRVNYAYAEILQHKEKKEQARRYFAQAERQLSEIKDKDISKSLDEAYLLFRNNHIEEALELYRRLLAQFPQNKTVRADFAEVLLQTRQYDEAALVLSQ